MARESTSAAATSTGFRGWPPSAFDFYVGLEADNTKTYWAAHREVYERDVRAPFLALSGEVEHEFGPLRVFRPYRDVRFAKDKSPYKTNAAAVTEGEGGTAYYVSISSEGLFVASGYYQLEPDQLERYREAVADGRRGARLATEVERLRAAGYEISAHETLKTVPRGYPKDHPRADLLRQKGCIAGRSFPVARWMHTRAALDRVIAVWRDAAAMNRWLDRHVGPSTIPPPAP